MHDFDVVTGETPRPEADKGRTSRTEGEAKRAPEDASRREQLARERRKELDVA